MLWTSQPPYVKVMRLPFLSALHAHLDRTCRFDLHSSFYLDFHMCHLLSISRLVTFNNLSLFVDTVILHNTYISTTIYLETEVILIEEGGRHVGSRQHLEHDQEPFCC